MNSSNMDNETGLVKEVHDDQVLVEVKRKGSCKNCSVNMLCMANANKATFLIDKPSYELSCGDEVLLEISPADRIFSSLIIFIFPILTMILFYFVVRYLFGLSENIAIFSSILGLLFSGICIKIIDKKTADKISIKITGKICK